jgi:hypothetical protein
VKSGAYGASAAMPGIFYQNASLRCELGQKHPTNSGASQMPQSIASVRPERSYSVNIYDMSADSWSAFLRCQFGHKYDQKKVGNT